MHEYERHFNLKSKNIIGKKIKKESFSQKLKWEFSPYPFPFNLHAMSKH